MHFKKHNISTDSSSDRISQARQGTSKYRDTGNTYFFKRWIQNLTDFQEIIVFSEPKRPRSAKNMAFKVNLRCQ